MKRIFESKIKKQKKEEELIESFIEPWNRFSGNNVILKIIRDEIYIRNDYKFFKMKHELIGGHFKMEFKSLDNISILLTLSIVLILASLGGYFLLPLFFKVFDFGYKDKYIFGAILIGYPLLSMLLGAKIGNYFAKLLHDFLINFLEKYSHEYLEMKQKVNRELLFRFQIKEEDNTD